MRLAGGEWVAPAGREASMTGPAAFRFLGEDGSLDEHGWDGPQRSKLWRYNQHYFDDLNAQGAKARRNWHHALIQRWIAENPPTQGAGWEPYTISLRMVNWIKFALGGRPLSYAARDSLARQARWLRKRLEWHLLGNHLFANAKALVFAGLYFSGKEAESWLETGVQILREQLPEQILTDGAHFELSPMYHAIVLEDVIDLLNMASLHRDEPLSRVLSTELSTRIPAMLDWLLAMSHPDGKIAFFNDAAFAIAPETKDLCGYAQRLGFAATPPSARLIHHRPSGYVRMEQPNAVLIGDLASIGPDYLPGHAHADTLSFEFSLHGRRLIVNSGTSVYGTGEERLRQRGTAAHSTLVIDGSNSSEVWSGFRVGRRAGAFDIAVSEADTSISAEGAHDGFAHLPGSPVHRRRWRLDEGCLLIDDTIEGSGNHEVEVYYHLGPDFNAQFDKAENVVWIMADDNAQWRADFMAQDGDVEVIASSWHPEFGAHIPTKAIRVSTSGALPLRLRSELRWSAL